LTAPYRPWKALVFDFDGTLAELNIDFSAMRTALRILKASPDKAAMVGDHPIDIHLGRDAGAFTIGVLTGHSGREDFLAARADLILAKAPQILNYLF
jgi:phosphoglycolate phosphatase-like HAD superfamily hydrolase